MSTTFQECMGDLSMPEAMTSNDVLMVIGILDQVDSDLVEGHIGAARTRVRCLQSSLLKQADVLRAREGYYARSDSGATP